MVHKTDKLPWHTIRSECLSSSHRTYLIMSKKSLRFALQDLQLMTHWWYFAFPWSKWVPWKKAVCRGGHGCVELEHELCLHKRDKVSSEEIISFVLYNMKNKWWKSSSLSGGCSLRPPFSSAQSQMRWILKEWTQLFFTECQPLTKGGTQLTN